MKKQLKLIFGASAMVLAIAIAGVAVFRPTAEAAAAMVTVGATAAEDSGSILRVDLQLGGLRQGVGFFGDDTYLADALGITVAELETAREEARTAAIEQAVEDGLLTREQADELLL